MVGIIEQAIVDLKSRDFRFKCDAGRWFRSRERDYLFSFEHICFFLSLDVRKVKEAVLEPKFRTFKKMAGSHEIERRIVPKERNGSRSKKIRISQDL